MKKVAGLTTLVGLMSTFGMGCGARHHASPEAKSEDNSTPSLTAATAVTSEKTPLHIQGESSEQQLPALDKEVLPATSEPTLDQKAEIPLSAATPQKSESHLMSQNGEQAFYQDARFQKFLRDQVAEKVSQKSSFPLQQVENDEDDLFTAPQNQTFSMVSQKAQQGQSLGLAVADTAQQENQASAQGGSAPQTLPFDQEQAQETVQKWLASEGVDGVLRQLAEKLSALEQKLQGLSGEEATLGASQIEAERQKLERLKVASDQETFPLQASQLLGDLSGLERSLEQGLPPLPRGSEA